MDLDYILNEVERERRIIKVADFFFEATKDKEEEIQRKAAKIVSKHRPVSSIGYYNQGWLKGQDLIEVIKQSPQVLIGLPESEINNLHSNYFKRDRESHLLNLIAAHRPDCFSACYSRELSSNSWLFRARAAGALQYLADSHRDKFVELFEEGFESGDTHLKAGLAASLPKLLSIDKAKAVKYYLSGLSDKEDLVREEVIHKLGDLARVDFFLLGRLYDHLLDEKDEFTSTIAHQLVGLEFGLREQILATLSEEKAEKLRELMPQKVIHPPEEILPKSEGLMCGDNPESIDKINEKSLNDLTEGLKQTLIKDYERRLEEALVPTPVPFSEITRGNRERAFEILGTFVRLAPDKAFEFYKKSFNSKDNITIHCAARVLKYLAEVRPIQALQFCKKLTDIRNKDDQLRDYAVKAREIALKSIELSAEKNPQKFVDDCIERFDNLLSGDVLTRFFGSYLEEEIHLLGLFTRFAPDQSVKYYENGLGDSDLYTQQRTAEALKDLAAVKPNKALELCKKALLSEDKEVRSFAVDALDSLLCSLESPAWEPIVDEEYRFIQSYLASEYIKKPNGRRKPKKEIVAELMNLVRQRNNNYHKLNIILQEGKAKNLKEMLECGAFELNDFIILGKLGSGAIKTAFLAKDKYANREVVLLQINPNSKGYLHYTNLYHNIQPEDIEKKIYETEFSVIKLSALKSKHVVSMQTPTKGSFNGKEFIFLPTQDKYEKTLEDAIRSKKIDYMTALSYFHQICVALKECHEIGVVHKDLKPDNIGIGPGGNIILSDFGCTSMFSEDADSRYQCPLELRPPELAYGEEHWKKQDKKWQSDLFTPEANIWSAGVILYRMLTGKHLFNRPKKRATIGSKKYHQQNEAVYRQIREFKDYQLEEICGELKEKKELGFALLEMCIKKNPEHRKSSLKECLMQTSHRSFIRKYQ